MNDRSDLTSLVAQLGQRVARLEAENAARRVLAEYMRLCDQLDGSVAPEQLGELFTTDAVWEGLGARYGAVFGRHIGRSAIVAFLSAYQGPPPFFALNVHSLTSESITAESDDLVLGSWVMLQVSTLSSGASTLRGARLNIRFGMEDDRWRMTHFQTTNLFSRSYPDSWENTPPGPISDGH